MALPAVGEVFAGKYAIEAVVGRGGMGVVLAARHLELDERVAIKLILAEEGPKAAEFIARFVREAKLASKIKSEHVVRVIDVARLESGEPYIVMELLEGHDLADLLSRHGPLPIELAAFYVLQACEAIAEAHALGIVHRDLKPANLFLATLRDGRPCVKVLDFGISKLMGEQGGHAMTRTDALMGSPLYMSPDQLVQSRDLDARSDVWALGVILYELLSGQAPFDGENAPQLIAQILHRPAPPLSTLRPDVPRELEALIDAALAKDRAQRLPNVAELARGLLPFAPEAARFSVERIAHVVSRSAVVGAPPNTGGVQASWRAVSSSAGRGTPSATAGGAALDLGATRKSSKAVPIVAALVMLVAAAAVAAFFLMARAKAPAPASVLPPAGAAPAPVASAATPATPSAGTEAAPAAAASGAPLPSSSAAVASAAPRPKLAPQVARPVAAKPTSKPATALPVDPFGGVR